LSRNRHELIFAIFSPLSMWEVIGFACIRSSYKATLGSGSLACSGAKPEEHVRHAPVAVPPISSLRSTAYSPFPPQSANKPQWISYTPDTGRRDFLHPRRSPLFVYRDRQLAIQP
jgi:hypothetical protein